MSSSRTKRVILTHENADFDAVASLLAASKLYPDATPVLPRRVNRNGRAFLALYGGELPLVRPKDLPRGTIDRAILVDTQSLTTLKGMRPDLEVLIIDHHPLTRELPDNWEFTGEQLGATTTLLVEEIAAQGLALSPVEATLLLLGVYEDTGSLSYLTTTARDAHAAGWLLERGASLSVANEYLHHPLTPAQKELYEQLVNETESHQIHGHYIVVAASRAASFEDELSTLAHKLRDLLEPAALFMLVALDGHVQLVARSSTDAVDVSRVARHFGGGGHTRAAAALVRDRPLASIRADLLELLPEVVRPAMVVERIMSHGVRVLETDTPIAKALERMERTGHEGFPVVEAGHVVGLLTRQAVDRAKRHGLEKRAVSEIMDAGEVWVTPDDSVEALQARMTEHGWGQMPVVENGRVIGVVTRTDLIKLWGPTVEAPDEEEISQRLHQALSPAVLSLVRRISKTSAGMGYSLYFVGGLVRDLLLGAPIVDIDLVVEGDAIKLARKLRQKHGGRVRSHRRFGTAKWLLEDAQLPSGDGEVPEAIDFVTARTEFYTHPTALPQVEQSSIKQDLHRRDFTINTLAIRLDPDHFGELLDFYGGKNDLQQGLIRVLHSLSFVEDPTRILRAARFEARLDFHLEARTKELVDNAIPLLNRISGDRIRHELVLIFYEEEPERALCRLQELGALEHVMPGLICDDWLKERYQALRQAAQDPVWDIVDQSLVFPYLALLLYRLSPGMTRAGLRRLKFKRDDADRVNQVQQLKKQLPNLSPEQANSDLYRWLSPYPAEVLLVVWVAEDEPVREAVRHFQSTLRGVRPQIDGKHLIEHYDLQPGPHFGRLLKALRDARLDGRVETLEEERALLEELLAQDGTHKGEEKP